MLFPTAKECLVIPTLPLLLAFAATVVLAKLLERPAIHAGLMDRPDRRKRHARSVPLTGGLSLLIAFGLATLLLPIPLRDFAPLYAGIAVMAIVGLVDDVTGLPAIFRFAAQLLMAVLVVAGGGPVLADLGTLPNGAMLTLGVFALPVTIVAIVGFVNSMNMMDGADGLAGSVAVVILAGIGWAAHEAGDERLLMLAATLGAAILGFLVFNLRAPWRRRATIFMGDSGSLALGFILVYLVIETAMLPQRVVSPLGIAYLVALPVIETLSLIVRRLSRGQNPLHPDREHFHHILRRAGFSIGETTTIIALVTALLGAIGLLASARGVADGWLWLGLITLAVAHFLFTEYGWRSIHALQRLRQWSRTEGSGWQLTGRRMAPWRRWLARSGYYLMLATPLFMPPLALVGLGLLILAVVIPGGRFSRSLMRQLPPWLMVALLGWVVFSAIPHDTPAEAIWQGAWMSGVLALPLGWWLASEPRQIVTGALLLAGGVILSALVGTPPGLDGDARLMMAALPVIGALVICLAWLLRGYRRRQWVAVVLFGAGLFGAVAGLVLAYRAPVMHLAETPMLVWMASDLGALQRAAGWPAVILLGLLLGVLLAAVVRLCRLGAWRRRWALAALLTALVLLLTIASGQVVDTVAGGVSVTFVMALLVVGAMQWSRVNAYPP